MVRKGVENDNTRTAECCERIRTTPISVRRKKYTLIVKKSEGSFMNAGEKVTRNKTTFILTLRMKKKKFKKILGNQNYWFCMY